MSLDGANHLPCAKLQVDEKQDATVECMLWKVVSFPVSEL